MKDFIHLELGGNAAWISPGVMLSPSQKAWLQRELESAPV